MHVLYVYVFAMYAYVCMYTYVSTVCMEFMYVIFILNLKWWNWCQTQKSGIGQAPILITNSIVFLIIPCCICLCIRFQACTFFPIEKPAVQTTSTKQVQEEDDSSQKADTKYSSIILHDREELGNTIRTSLISKGILKAGKEGINGDHSHGRWRRYTVIPWKHEYRSSDIK